ALYCQRRFLNLEGFQYKSLEGLKYKLNDPGKESALIFLSLHAPPITMPVGTEPLASVKPRIHIAPWSRRASPNRDLSVPPPRAIDRRYPQSGATHAHIKCIRPVFLAFGTKGSKAPLNLEKLSHRRKLKNDIILHKVHGCCRCATPRLRSAA